MNEKFLKIDNNHFVWLKSNGKMKIINEKKLLKLIWKNYKKLLTKSQ